MDPAPPIMPEVAEIALFESRRDRYCLRESKRYLVAPARNHRTQLRMFNQIREKRIYRILMRCRPILPANRAAIIDDFMRYIRHLKNINVLSPVIIPSEWTMSDKEQNIISIGLTLVRASSYLECDPPTMRHFRQQERIQNMAAARERYAAYRAANAANKLIEKTKAAPNLFLETVCPETCGICMDTHLHADTVKTSCGHCFGRECYQTMLSQKGATTKYTMGENNICPICRFQNPVLNYWRQRAVYTKKNVDPAPDPDQKNEMLVQPPDEIEIL
jgi:hypothetical protein